MRILGIIPARSGSKGIRHKNIFPLAGKPLIKYTIDEALKSNLCDLVLTTDSDEIGQYYHKVIVRPPHLAQDDTLMLPVIQHVLENYGSPIDAVMLLQPTSPLRITEDINNAIQKFIDYDTHYSNCDSLISVCKGIHPIKCYDEAGTPFMPQEAYDKHIHKCYVRNGAIFIAKTELIKGGRLIGDRPLLFEMPKSRSIDVDDMQDLMIVEALLKVGELH